MRFGKVWAGDGLNQRHVALFVMGLEGGEGEAGLTVGEDEDDVRHCVRVLSGVEGNVCLRMSFGRCFGA